MFTLTESETHRDAGTPAAGLPALAAAPTDVGVLTMLVRRPGFGAREVLAAGELSCEIGLVGDGWSQRSSKRTPDGSPHPDMQLTLMSVRVLAAIADPGRWPLTGEQLLVDLDLSPQNLPAGARLEVGSAVIEVTAQPHTGCAKFAERFGGEALRFVNTGVGRQQRFRGLNARVVVAGTVRAGDRISVPRS